MDQFENEVSDMLKGRAAAMPEPPAVTPALLVRARRRRVTKLTALVATVVVVAAGTTAAVAQVVGRRGPDRIATAPEPSTTLPGTPTVPTVVCPVTDPYTDELTAPSSDPRVPAAGDPAVLGHLVSFAGLADTEDVVLGPKDWSCHTTISVDHHQDAHRRISDVVVYDPQVSSGSVPSNDAAPIAIESNILWNEPSGVLLACSVFDDPAVVRVVLHINEGCLKDERAAHRTVTRINAHVATFIDADGSRGAGWIVLPSSDSANDGEISVLTCRPRAGEISAAQCDTIIADYAARAAADASTDTTVPRSTTTGTEPVATTTVPASVPTVACPISYAITDHGPPPVPPTAPRVPSAGDPRLYSGLSSFAPLDDPRYIVLGPKDWSCQTSFATDGDNGVVVYKTASPPATAPDLFTAPIAIENDWMWHGLSGTATACTVSTDPAVLAEAASDQVPCAVPAGRVLSRIDAHASTFLDADGTRGASWILLPTTPNGADGKLSVLTCRPTDGLTAAQCDTIIDDWVARNDTAS